MHGGVVNWQVLHDILTEMRAMNGKLDVLVDALTVEDDAE
jgi:hypothetical protein